MNDVSQVRPENVCTEFRVSVVVPCRDRASQLEVCLSAVSRLDPPPAEVIVVDSYSRSGDAVREVAIRNSARYLRVESPGLSLARNVGSRSAAGNIIAFLDDDAVPARDWLLHLVRPFIDPHVGCVTGRVEAPPDALDGRECELLGYVRGYNSPTSISIEDANWFEAACFGGIGIGPNLSIRKSIFSEWTGFCERLGLGTSILGNEEGYAFLELIRLGYTIKYASGALVTHPVPMPERTILQRRYHTNLAASTAFLLMLIFEESGCRWRALKYLLGKLGKISTLWSRGKRPQGARLIPGWHVTLARASGLLCYSRSLATLVRNKRNSRSA